MFPSHYILYLIRLLPRIQISWFNGPWRFQTVLLFFQINFADPTIEQPSNYEFCLFLLFSNSITNYLDVHKQTFGCANKTTRLFNQFPQLARLFPGGLSLFIRAEVMWGARDSASGEGWRGGGGRGGDGVTGLKRGRPFNKLDARSRLSSWRAGGKDRCIGSSDFVHIQFHSHSWVIYKGQWMNSVESLMVEQRHIGDAICKCYRSSYRLEKAALYSSQNL